VAEEKTPPASSMKRGRLVGQPGQPLQFVDVVDVDSTGTAASSIGEAVASTLKAYREAAHKLLQGRYANQKDLAPAHLRQPCNIFVLRCPDGMLVRYDAVVQGDPKVRYAEAEVNLSDVAPQFSEQVIHFPEDPSSYVPSGAGPEIVLSRTHSGGASDEFARLRPVIYATTTLPADFEMPPPSARPTCLVSVQNEVDLQLHGVALPADEPAATIGPNSDQFIAHSRVTLNVGWQTMEVYPPLGGEYWKPEYAAGWAELDILAAVAQRNLTVAALRELDGRAETRKLYATLLDQFDALLTGAEEPVHQFLKSHPEILCPTSERSWSKLAFGDRVSDFVFREPYNDYLLVEIEASDPSAVSTRWATARGTHARHQSNYR
jgi:hypothetical protein